MIFAATSRFSGTSPRSAPKATASSVFPQTSCGRWASAPTTMRKRGNSSRSAAPELEEVLDSEIFKTACRAAGLVPFRCDRAGNFSGLAENSDCWPFRDGRPAPPAEWMAAEDLDLFQAGWDDLLADRKKEMLLRYRVDRPGFPLHYELYLFRMEDETGFAGVIRDVTEEKTGEAAVEETNIMYRSLLDSLLGWVFAKDPDNGFRYVMVNRSRNLFIGNHMGDVIGKTDEEIFSPEVAMRHRRQDEEIVRTGLEYRGIGSYADPEGKISHVRIFKRLYVRPDGSRLILGIGIDVTHEYELECEFGRNVEKLNLHIRDERSMGLLLAAERPTDSREDVNFILRNLNKAVLGCADALLIGAGRYRYRLDERLAAFETLAAECGMTPEWPERYARALEFKARPDFRIPENWDAAWDGVRRFWCGSVAGVAGCPAGSSPGDVVSALHRKSVLHGGKGLMNCLNWVRKTHAPGGAVREWFDAPELRMLYLLYRLLAASGPARREIAAAEERRRLYRMWKSIN